MATNFELTSREGLMAPAPRLCPGDLDLCLQVNAACIISMLS